MGLGPGGAKGRSLVRSEGGATSCSLSWPHVTSVLLDSRSVARMKNPLLLSCLNRFGGCCCYCCCCCRRVAGGLSCLQSRGGPRGDAGSHRAGGGGAGRGRPQVHGRKDRQARDGPRQQPGAEARRQTTFTRPRARQARGATGQRLPAPFFFLGSIPAARLPHFARLPHLCLALPTGAPHQPRGGLGLPARRHHRPAVRPRDQAGWGQG